MDQISLKAIQGLTAEKRIALRQIMLKRGIDPAGLPILKRPADLVSLPVSYGQQRLWFIHHLQDNAAAYNVATAVRLSGPLSADILQLAFNEVIKRHEILRTNFRGELGGVHQIIRAHWAFELPMVDLSHRQQAERESELLRAVQSELVETFDLSSDGLMRASLLRLAPDEHVLLVTMHHIISDSWSMQVLLREITEFYHAFSAGSKMGLSELEIQYADYAYWQRCWLQADLHEKQLAYWREKLYRAAKLLNLSSDRMRPEIPGNRGATLKWIIDPSVKAGLSEFCDRQHVTLFMVLTAAFHVLLWRHSGEKDTCIGTPTAGRLREELEPLIGFFGNTLVLRTPLQEEERFCEFLERVKATVLEAQTHQDVPYELIVEQLKLPAAANVDPLFQVMLILQNVPESPATETGDLEMEVLDKEGRWSKLDLTLNVTEANGQLKTEYEFSTDLFDAERIQKMALEFEEILRQMLADPEILLRQLGAPASPRLDQSRISVLLPTACADGLSSDFLEQFQANASSYPSRIAIESSGKGLSYGALSQRVNRLAHELRKHGVGPEVTVALCIERSAERIVALLAILQAGGAYLPLESSYPRDRLAFMLKDGAPAFVITTAMLAHRLEGMKAPLRILDALELDAGQQPVTPVSSLTRPDNLAYVAYTSGSTGVPKGVEVTRGNLSTYVDAAIECYGLTCEDRILHAGSISFDLAVEEIFPTLARGATLVILPFEQLPAVEDFRRVIDQSRLTVVSLPTAYWHEWVALDADMRAIPLRLVIVGGEEVSQFRYRQWVEKTGGKIAWINSYGPTEATVVVTAGHADADGHCSLGRPMGLSSIYILDEYQQPVSWGAAGEIYIGGPQVARGYRNRPELTEQHFRNDPFRTNGDARMYRTGDHGRIQPDGTLHFSGRADAQVKIRGFRVETEEISSALQGMPGIHDAVVVGRRPAEDASVELFAYVVAEPEATVDVSQLYHELGARFPDYMVPRRISLLPRMPVTPNGKIDFQALPQQSGSMLRRAYEAPKNELQQRLADLWNSIFEQDSIGIHDNFFELGGNSLLALRLVSLLGKQLGREMPVNYIFAAPTIDALSQRIAQQRGEASQTNCVCLRSSGTSTPIFAIHAGDGEIGYVRDLEPWLAKSHPIYAFAASGFGEGEPIMDDVEQIADHYLRMVTEIQKEGPYIFIGWSTGGTIAYAMALRLRRLGKDVALLCLIDTTAPVPYSGLGVTPAQVTKASVLLHYMADAELTEPVRALLDELASENDVDKMLQVYQAEGVIDAQIESATLLRHLEVRHALAFAEISYLPEAIDVPVHYFVAENAQGENLSLGWQDFLGASLNVIPLPGDHCSIVLPPGNQRLGAEVARLLASLDLERR